MQEHNVEFSEFIAKAKEVQRKYAALNERPWGATEYTQGLIGDVGDLVKLVMAKNRLRKVEDVDQKLHTSFLTVYGQY